MKKIYIILLVVIFNQLGFSQQKRELVEGKISYISSQNIYAKFNSTNGINVGDTLFVKLKNGLEPISVVKYISSKSCSGKKLSTIKTEIGTLIYAFVEEKVMHEESKIIVQSNEENKSRTKKNKRIVREKGGDVVGRLSVSSYGNISSMSNSDFVRWRYTFSGHSQNFRNSKISFDSYVSFNYRSTEWSYVKNNISDALKIYSLSVNYQFNENIGLTFGRKINKNISNVGAIDGLQLVGKFNNFTMGAVVGSRPDYFNYTINLKLFEFGGFVNHSFVFSNGSVQNSLALFQQTNNSKIDRRFLYFQHSSSLLGKINLFLSSEIDLYKRVNMVEKKDFSLTGLFASIRYAPMRAVSFNVSYDSRKNVIYYETFQNYTDSLYENATRQGLRFRVNIKPLKRLFVNLRYGYRFRTGDIKSSENYSGNISYSSLPFISGTFGLNYNHLSTSYLKGDIYGLRYSRDILQGTIYGSIDLRRINYLFMNGAPDLQQSVLGIDFSWRIMKKLSLSANYEGTFGQDFNYGRIFFNLTKRF